MLRRLLLRRKLLVRRIEFFFLRVLFRMGSCWSSPAEKLRTELVRSMAATLLMRLLVGPSMMELPRWLASHSSVNLPRPARPDGEGEGEPLGVRAAAAAAAAARCACGWFEIEFDCEYEAYGLFGCW